MAGTHALTAGICLAASAAVPEGFHDVFSQPDLPGWNVAHYAFSHPHFDTDWSRSNLKSEETGLELLLSPKSGSRNRFNGASLRQEHATGYGRYEAILQPASGDGLVTGFFIYTGPFYGTRHDEIDMEFLGRDTTAVHLSWFIDGARQSKRVPLGFDAAHTGHNYAFEWAPEGIRWYADGRLLYALSAGDAPLPEIPGRLFVNLWAADPALESWTGLAAPGTHARALLHEISFIPLEPAQLAQAVP